MQLRFLAALFVTAFLLPGCSTVRTVNEPVGKEPVTGNFYFLPRGKVRIVGARLRDSPSVFAITISQLLETDPQERYFLRHSTNVFYDDEIKIVVNEKGLLTTVNTTSEDKTASIAGSLAGIVGDVLKFGAGTDSRSLVEDSRQPFSFVFDPFVDAEVQRIDAALRPKGFKLTVTRPLVRGAESATASSLEGKSIDAAGVVFRPLRPVNIAIDDSPSLNSQTESLVVILPDPQTKLLFDFRRAAFIKKITKTTFVDGTLREVEVNRPSQVAGLLAIPKEILKAIVPLPLELKNTQIQNINAEKGIIDAEKALKDAQKAQQEDKKKEQEEDKKNQEEEEQQ